MFSTQKKSTRTKTDDIMPFSEECFMLLADVAHSDEYKAISGICLLMEGNLKEGIEITDLNISKITDLNISKITDLNISKITDFNVSASIEILCKTPDSDGSNLASSVCSDDNLFQRLKSQTLLSHNRQKLLTIMKMNCVLEELLARSLAKINFYTKKIRALEISNPDARLVTNKMASKSLPHLHGKKINSSHARANRRLTSNIPPFPQRLHKQQKKNISCFSYPPQRFIR